MTTRDAEFVDLGLVALLGQEGSSIFASEEDLHALVDLKILPSYQNSKDGRLQVRPSDVKRFAARVRRGMKAEGLFPDPSIFRSVQPVQNLGERIFIQLPLGVIISYLPGVIDASKIQLFIAALGEILTSEDELDTIIKDWDCIEINDSLSVWIRPRELVRLGRSVHEIWANAESLIGVTDEAESRSILSVYGSKARISDFVTGVVARYMREGDSILDLMSGTGIVARKLATYGYQVFANDANLFAALATKSLAAATAVEGVQQVLAKIEAPFLENYSFLADVFEEPLEIETHFLHGEVNASSLDQYREFISAYTLFLPSDLVEGVTRPEPISPAVHARVSEMITERHYHPRLFPYCLISGYFSNAYFGLKQSLELDSLRYAIDSLNVTSDVADFLLGCLLSTAIACASGPHFAQPPKLHNVRAMREIIEHRARSLYEDFKLRVVLAKRGAEGQGRVKWVGNADWRIALENYLVSVPSMEGVRRRAIYLDPPYTKLQYSRYYHLLNTLVSYNYPRCERMGRYPPREVRFSSRFEFQPRSAKRELKEVLSLASREGIIVFLSYSNRGFIPITDLIQMAAEFYDRVDVFSREIRHHSQGIQSSRSRITEFIVAGVFNE